jgi:hypothetical protein
MTITISEVVVVVLGLSQWFKTKAGLQGAAAEWLSFGIGVVLGGFYQYVVTSPVDAGGYFSVVVVGVGMGLVPSGLYKFAGTLAEKFGLSQYFAAVKNNTETK